MAGPEGFEPPACRLGGGRSIQLSYGPVAVSILARCRAKTGPLRQLKMLRLRCYRDQERSGSSLLGRAV